MVKYSFAIRKTTQFISHQAAGLAPISSIPTAQVQQEFQEAELLSFFPERIPCAAEGTVQGWPLQFLSHISAMPWPDNLNCLIIFAFNTNWLLQEHPCLVHAELRESGSKPFLHEGIV